jgi:hypothetical protein
MLNLERVPSLAPKFANKLGKTAAAFTVAYTPEGTRVLAVSMLDTKGVLIQDAKDYPSIALVEFERRCALKNQPTEADKLAALRRKYELRLGRAFPAPGPTSGSDSDVQAWLATLSLEERLALLKSQKDWEAMGHQPTPAEPAAGQAVMPAMPVVVPTTVLAAPRGSNSGRKSAKSSPK